LGSGIGPPPVAGHQTRRPQMIAAATTSREDRDPTVLVAEEDDAARAFLADNLSADGYDVRTAESKEKAFAILSVASTLTPH
jgi:response regulator RpfG family c-di-GMP phosphodiesterase